MDQHTGNKARAIYTKITHQCRDMFHKLNGELVKENAAILVGGVSLLKLLKMRTTKSMPDSGWGMPKEERRSTIECLGKLNYSRRLF